MSEFRTVCRVHEVPEGEGKTVEVNNRLIAVFRAQGVWYALDDVCPHMGASLSGGWVEEGAVTCPWHAWQFRLGDGSLVGYSKIKVGCYPVRIQNDEVQIAFNAASPNPPNPKEQS